jgi:type I restriction enzyme, S subunit
MNLRLFLFEELAANGRECPHFVNTNLPTGWSSVSFGDYASRLNTGPFGSLIGKGDYVRDGVPLINPSHMRSGRIAAEVGVAVSPEKASELTPYALATGDIVFARRGEVGRTALVTEDEDGWLCGTGSFFARFEEEVDRAFLQLIFDSVAMRRYLAGEAVGVTMVNLNQRMLRNATLDIPPLAEQHRIVARVEELMKLCDALEQSGRLADEQHARLTSTLFDALAASESAHALAENWQRIAGHFDLLLDRPEAIAALETTVLTLAFQGKLVPQDPSEALDVSVVQMIGASQPKPIDETEIPFEEPGSWRWTRLGWVAELINGDRGKNYPNKSEYVPVGLPFINTGHIEPDGTLSQESMHFLTKRKFDSLRGGKTQPGDLVYCLRGATLGKTAVVEYIEGAIASSLVIIRLNDAVNRKYAYYFLISPLGRALVRRFDNGSAQPNLAANSVKRYVMPLPPLAEQHRIVARVEELRRL